MRIYALYIVVAALSVYAYRDWFKSLCGLILLMAVIEHPDMPKNLMGIQGLNPWNVLMFNVVVAWLISRRREGLVWDMPRYFNVMLSLYLGVIVIGFLRMMADRTGIGDLSTGYLISDWLINVVKWVIPGLLLFDGCRTSRRLTMGLVCTLALNFLLALQVIRWMPPSAAMTGDSLSARSRKIILREVGYSSVNMSMMLAGASWAIATTLPLVRRNRNKVLIIAASLIVVYGQALTSGRMGYVTWMAVGLILGVLRWRKLLLLIPVLLVVISFAVPGAVDRMFEGFDATDVAGEQQIDDYQVTSGRTLIWPYVIDKIMESPIVGHGFHAMQRTGLTDLLWTEVGESFPHAHNAYLECLLDYGLIGFAVIVPFYFLVVVHAGRLFLNRRCSWSAALGGVALTLVLAFLLAGTGSQHFYPREGAVSMWCAMGLMLRYHVQRQEARCATGYGRI